MISFFFSRGWGKNQNHPAACKVWAVYSLPPGISPAESGGPGSEVLRACLARPHSLGFVVGSINKEDALFRVGRVILHVTAV
tara:strand:- start:421 stop:666 length:246 start_codon:yes stop_codon:yes gene_type:complete